MQATGAEDTVGLALPCNAYLQTSQGVAGLIYDTPLLANAVLANAVLANAKWASAELATANLARAILAREVSARVCVEGCDDKRSVVMSTHPEGRG